jgi:hypothetical protein
MSILRASIAVALALAATIASAEGAKPSLEERLLQLEAEQAAMRQQLTERDSEIQELRRELQAGQAQAGSAAAPAVAATAPVQPPAAAGSTVAPKQGIEPVDPYQVAGQAPPTPGRPEAREETWGVYDPGLGFLVGRNEYGELDISAYALARYIDQNDSDGVFKDHLGNERTIDLRNDIFSHRVMAWLKGWVGDPKLVYTITLWTVNTTDQQAIFANLGYQFSPKFSLYAGMVGNPGSRSLVGSHPYWLGNDRVMADEFFRPYFGSGVYANGEILPGLWYQAVVSNNNSALGVKASQLDRKLTTGATMWWMPTTHEFGPRGAYGDWEWHEELATRFGFGYVDSPEQSFRDSSGSAGNTTLRLADSVNLFETGSLAPGVTIQNADYQVLSVDAGIKYKGFFLQTEYYQRWLDNFDANGLLPVREIKDSGWYLQGAFYPIRRVLELYAATSQIYGDSDAGFGNATEYLIGTNWYPFDTRNHRLNVQLMDVNGSPVSSTFGYYTGGQDGWTLATAFSIFF